ncbi:hypothetical protein [Methyloligella solikamskensis]|uniref:Uncharacterized protein n=1 Tax=Methyloligella solikamskensis TaxID=1177756 RepID=A0ABW3JCX5_9HYPH
MIAKGIVVLILLGTVVLAILAALNQWPETHISKLVGKPSVISGALIGGALTIFAGWLAWEAVQQQLPAQQRATQVAELTYWQQRLGEAEMGIVGLKLIRRTVVTPLIEVLDDFDRAQDDHPYTSVLDEIRATGAFDHSMWPSTGPGNLLGWELNYHLSILRVQWDRSRGQVDEPVVEEIERSAQNSIVQLQRIIQSFDAEIAKQRENRDRARKTLALIEEKSLD